MDGLKSVFFICMVPVLYTDRIGLGTAPLWGKIYKDSSALICSFAPSREMRWLGHREELRGSQEMGSFSGLSEIILCGGISQWCLKTPVHVPIWMYEKKKYTLKSTHCFGLSQFPCMCKRLRVNDTLLNLSASLWSQWSCIGRRAHCLFKVWTKFFFSLFCLRWN